MDDQPKKRLSLRGAGFVALVFAAGLAVGYGWGSGNARSRVVFSGAMSGLEDRAFLGPEDALVTVVEYTDYECTFCQRYYQTTFPILMEEYGGRIRYFVRHFPVPSIHPFSVGAAVAAACAEEQGRFWDYHDLLFSDQANLSPDGLREHGSQIGLDSEAFEECIVSEEPLLSIQEDLEQGVSYGVRGTPAFFINGRVVFGAQSLDAFRATIDAALEDMEG